MANRLVEPVRQTDAANIPNTASSIGITSTLLVPANPGRVEVTICNDHASQVIYLSLGSTAIVNSGIRLNAGGGSYTTNSFTGAISAIASGAATAVCYTEV